MLKFCLKQWDKNKDKLRKTLETEKGLNDCDYSKLVELISRDILEISDFCPHATEIYLGDYSGTIVFVIPINACCSQYDFLVSYVDYGSCSGCDTLMAIQKYGDGCLTSEQVKDFMELCKDIVTNIVKPYNKGWYHDDKFDEVEYE